MGVGAENGGVGVWDINKGQVVREWKGGDEALVSNDRGRINGKTGHHGRVGSIDWNGWIVASGSRDRRILLRDVRENKEWFCELKVTFGSHFN